MDRQQTCPCCDNSLLRHIRHGKIYWFCTHCWQEVPLLKLEGTQGELTSHKSEVTSNFSPSAPSALFPDSRLPTP
jgi:ribosomal protein L37AE/L43A